MVFPSLGFACFGAASFGFTVLCFFGTKTLSASVSKSGCFSCEMPT
jgi:hypothetical protein